MTTDWLDPASYNIFNAANEKDDADYEFILMVAMVKGKLRLKIENKTTGSFMYADLDTKQMNRLVEQLRKMTQ